MTLSCGGTNRRQAGIYGVKWADTQMQFCFKLLTATNTQVHTIPKLRGVYIEHYIDIECKTAVEASALLTRRDTFPIETVWVSTKCGKTLGKATIARNDKAC